MPKRRFQGGMTNITVKGRCLRCNNCQQWQQKVTAMLNAVSEAEDIDVAMTTWNAFKRDRETELVCTNPRKT